MAPRIKVCGIRSEADLRAAVDAGADAVGFLVGLHYVTNDVIDADTAAALAEATPPYVTRVLVTHRTDASIVAELVKEIPCEVLQLHGDFPVDRIPELRLALPRRVRVHRVVHVVGPEAVPFAAECAKVADAIHLDTRTEDRLGGTGLVHDWKLSMRIVKWIRRPVVLSGGLDPANVAEAIRTVRPWAVDANSGLENADGDKDPDKLRAFVKAVRAT